ncbi:type II CAAX endopeptidase family protein [Pontixanthobacter sp. CEM42]|uniref:CPBP family intramembrane glutamic endopeptidase n=1 Tax=Pontixanthobacter sp. CEM42 TaxID=2792077 RepID=UPI001AE0BA8F|nr:type II CAAX endopeptidase family protein [Pontixanthobacter sp. CEM42]
MAFTEIHTDELGPWRKTIGFPLVSLVVGIGLFALVMIPLSLALEQVPEMLNPAADMAIRAFAAVIAVFLLSKFVLRHLGEKPRDDLPLTGAFRDTIGGFLAGGWLITMVVGVAFVLGIYKIEGWGGSTDAAMIFLQMGLFAGFVEEVLLRGIVFRFLEEFGGSWAALTISALIFGFLHQDNPNATVFSSFAIAIEAGILLGAAYMLTRNLWLAIGIHAGWNVVQGYVWSSPVSGMQVDGLVASVRSGNDLLSGGAFGFEASVIALVIVTTFGLWMLWEARKRGHVMAPWWTRRRLAREAVGE